MFNLTPFEAMGWIGAISLAICCAPQALMSWKQKHSNGISSLLIILWGVGEVLTLLYVWPSRDWPLIFNYASNILLLAVIAWYKMYPQEHK